MKWRDLFPDPYERENALLQAQLESFVALRKSIEAIAEAIVQLNVRLIAVEDIMRKKGLAQ